MIITYYKKPNGQIDEAVAVATRVKRRDIQCASVILDFKTLSVLKCSMGESVVDKDFNRISGYYYQHYQNIVERLFKENGYEAKMEELEKTDPS
jgi:hypothetical protein